MLRQLVDVFKTLLRLVLINELNVYSKTLAFVSIDS